MDWRCPVHRRLLHAAVIVVVCASLTLAARAQQTAPSVQRIHYYNGDARVSFDLALDELFVLADRGVRVPTAQLRQTAPGIDVTEHRAGHARVRFAAPAASLAGLNTRAQALSGPGFRAGAVLYTAGAENRSDAAWGVLTGQFSLRLRDATTLQDVLDEYGLRVVRHAPVSGPVYIVEPLQDGVLAAVDAANAVFESGIVEYATPLVAYEREPRFTPNDTFFGRQWHLDNRGQLAGAIPGNDIDVAETWDSVRGATARINVVDSGLDQDHPDLAANVRTDLGLDINGGDSNPTAEFDAHGTAVAGVAAADGNNGQGVTGVAFEAELVGVRLIEDFITDADEADALIHLVNEADPNNRVWVSNNSWGPSDLFTTKVPVGPLVADALREGTTNGRGGRGVIYAWAAGNGRKFDNDINFDGYASSRFTIAVGASTGEGTFADYSEPGASMLVNAPSNSNVLGITTTDFGGSGEISNEFEDGLDPNGDYTGSFSGTSASAPVVSGVVALLLQANPTLGWRDVQHILVDSAFQNDPAHAAWRTNGSGRLFNPNYGFGRVDAGSAVSLGSTWTNVPGATFLRRTRSFDTPIPDGSPTGVTDALTFTRGGDVPDGFDFFVEHVEVEFSAAHPQQGDLEITLIAPSGFRSLLAPAHTDATDDYDDYLFTSVGHWGEDPVGSWVLKVADRFADFKGSFQGWTLRVYGYLIDRSRVFVDARFQGHSDGTANHPFTAIESATAAVNDSGSVVFLAEQSRAGGMLIDRPMRLEAENGPVRLGAGGS